MSDTPMCPRCAADPAPFGKGSSPRRCAFQGGAFTTDNWNCATMNALHALTHDDDASWCDDHQARLLPVQLPEPGRYGAFLVLTQYKSRGRIEGAHLIWADGNACPFTLADAEAILRRRAGA